MFQIFEHLPYKAKPSLCKINCVFRDLYLLSHEYSKTCLKRPLQTKRPKIGFQDRLSLNAGQKYCRILQEEHSAILSTFIKLTFVIKIFDLSIFEWPLKAGFTVIIYSIDLLSH